ncbi:TPA: DUF1108 family protein, partial [Staphylococcus pseudintermedius]|nr:DUF1108 family protein [Staphylococcus pseudintermedius]
MYFPNGEEYSGIIEVEGFKFRKHVTKEENHILIEITDMTYRLVVDTKVYSLSDTDLAQEVIN